MSSVDQQYSDLTFRIAKPEDVFQMHRVLEGIIQRMSVPSWFAPLSYDELIVLTGSAGFSILALSNSDSLMSMSSQKQNEIVAMIIVRTLYLGKHLKEILESVDISSENTALLEVVAVREQYRGRGLQVILSNLAENELIDRGFMTTLATVHPDNVFSLNNLFESGYRIIKKDEFYGGQPRFLVFKKLIK